MDFCDRIKERVTGRTLAWKDKSIHRKFYKELNSNKVHKEMLGEWISRDDIFPETEMFIFANQDQVVPTNNYKKLILKYPTVVDKCRKCDSKDETIQHILNGLNGCTQLVASGKILLQEIMKITVGKSDSTPYYKYDPERIVEAERYTIYLW